jgi:hypothetical protein
MAGNIFTYVLHQFAADYEAVGWTYEGSDDGVTALYRWAGKGKPTWPEYTAAMSEKELADFDAIWPGDGQ